MKIIKSFSVVASLTLLSNVFGYMRDAALAAKFGATTVTDAYFAAFFIPNTLYLILLSGSISTAFVPIFIEYLQKDKEDAWHIANSIINVSFLLLVLIILVGTLTVRYWMGFLFPGYSENTLQLSINLAVILLPMLLFTGLSSLLSAILNSFEHFTIPAVAPLIGNIVVIVVILLSDHLGGIYGVAVGVSIGMLVQLIVHLPLLKQFGIRYRVLFNFKHPAFSRLGKMVIPLTVYLIIAYASLVVERNIASKLPEGTVSALNYAIRLFTLPVVLIAGSISTVVYPRLSFEASYGDGQALSRNLLKAISGSTFFLMPLSFWMFINSVFVVELLFGFGRFSPEDIRLTAVTLSGYTIGMLATGLTRILQRAFYAMQDTITPLRLEIVNLIVYTGLALGLTSLWGAAGLAAARGLSFVILAFAFVVGLSKHRQIPFDTKRIFPILGRYLLASSCATAIWSLSLWIDWRHYHLLDNDRLNNFIITGIIGIFGLALYIRLVLWLDLDDMRSFSILWKAFIVRVANYSKGVR